MNLDINNASISYELDHTPICVHCQPKWAFKYDLWRTQKIAWNTFWISFKLGRNWTVQKWRKMQKFVLKVLQKYPATKQVTEILRINCVAVSSDSFNILSFIEANDCQCFQIFTAEFTLLNFRILTHRPSLHQLKIKVWLSMYDLYDTLFIWLFFSVTNYNFK